MKDNFYLIKILFKKLLKRKISSILYMEQNTENIEIEIRSTRGRPKKYESYKQHEKETVVVRYSGDLTPFLFLHHITS